MYTGLLGRNNGEDNTQLLSLINVIFSPSSFSVFPRGYIKVLKRLQYILALSAVPFFSAVDPAPSSWWKITYRRVIEDRTMKWLIVLGPREGFVRKIVGPRGGWMYIVIVLFRDLTPTLI